MSIEFYNFQRVHRIVEMGLKDALKNSTFKTVNLKAASQELKQVRLGCQHLCNLRQQQTRNQIRIHLLISQQVLTVARTWWETSHKCSIKTNRTSLTPSPFKQVFLNRIIEAQKLWVNLWRKIQRKTLRNWYLLIHNKSKNNLTLIKTYLEYRSMIIKIKIWCHFWYLSNNRKVKARVGIIK